jgi:hypothetical protein
MLVIPMLATYVGMPSIVSAMDAEVVAVGTIIGVVESMVSVSGKR